MAPEPERRPARNGGRETNGAVRAVPFRQRKHAAKYSARQISIHSSSLVA